jgi:pimeloyl-ACP methyl ester carboxylesterase
VSSLYRSVAGERRVKAWCRDRIAAWSPAHATATLTTSLGDTHLLSAGTGETVCLYLPGTNFNAATSLGLLDQLAARCRVVVADLPGQPGLSSSTRPRPETEGYAGWLEEVVWWVRVHQPAERLVVAGHSRGAAVALSAPADIDSLVLVSPAGIVDVRVSLPVLRTAVPWMMRPTERRSRALLELMSGPAAGVDSALAQWLTLVAQDSRTTGAPGALPDDVVSRWTDRPVRVLVGEHDCFFPPDRVRPAASKRLGSPVDVLPGLGHLAVEEDPELVARLLLG